ncbi:MAG: hypothetical protein Gyms2KO_33400 [Gymnodinialimonas sp.]
MSLSGDRREQRPLGRGLGCRQARGRDIAQDGLDARRRHGDIREMHRIPFPPLTQFAGRRGKMIEAQILDADAGPQQIRDPGLGPRMIDVGEDIGHFRNMGRGRLSFSLLACHGIARLRHDL